MLFHPQNDGTICYKATDIILLAFSAKNGIQL